MEQTSVNALVFGVLLGLWVALSAPLGGALAADIVADIVNVRLGVHADHTRIVIDLSGAASHQVEPQTRPDRVVIALDKVGFLQVMQDPPAGQGLVKSIRFEEGEAGAGSVILELTEPARVSQSQFLHQTDAAPARIFVDLRPGQAAGSGEPAAETTAEAASTAAAPDRPVQVASTEDVAIPEPPSAPEPEPDAATEDAVTLPLPPDKPAEAAEDDIGKLLAMIAPGVVPPEKPAMQVGIRKSTIVLDAGHGGKDPGAVGANGTMEKDITLQMAKELKDLLESTGRYNVVLTRDDDVLLALRERMEIARAAEADLFISLHADHIEKSTLRGASVYTLSENASDAEAASLAARENKEDLITGVNLSSQNAMVTSILIDLAQRETKNMSARFASMLAEELADHTQMISNSHRFAGFVVLKAPDVPSVLVELGYLSNADDEEALGLKRHRRVLAKAVRDALDRFFEWQRDVRRS